MNYKLEKFWNVFNALNIHTFKAMNYKLEKFWNKFGLCVNVLDNPWTINLKSFEMCYWGTKKKHKNNEL